MSYQSPVCRDRSEIIAWIESQKTFPSRKLVRKVFPEMPQKLIRAALESVKAKNAQEDGML